MFLAKVFITPKSTVNDPQGVTIHDGLHNLGFDTVRNVRMGKFMEITLDVSSEDDALCVVEQMCEKLLSNPVIEEYYFEINAII